MHNSDSPTPVNQKLYDTASSVEGYFTLEEASLLIETVHKSSDTASFLEIGSYKGRSTLFFASAMTERQQLFAVDAFLTPGSYSGHSFEGLRTTLSQTKTTILPMTMLQAFPHLRHFEFDVIFVDGDHSLLGIAQDICLSIELLRNGGVLLCHDVADWFPAIPVFLNMLVQQGILEPAEKRRTLAKFFIRKRPSWLTRAMPITGNACELPGPNNR